jgi:hypothetical protein
MLTIMLLTAALAADADVKQSRDCVSTTQIRNTAVLDDQTIIFELRDRSVWKNTLDYSCPRLGFFEAFSYESRGMQLCDLDTIKVIESSGFVGPTCGLGKFERQTQSLRELKTAAREQKAEQRKKL